MLCSPGYLLSICSLPKAFIFSFLLYFFVIQKMIPEVVTVDVSQAKTLLQSDHQYLDVRCALLSHHHDYVQVTNSSC